MNASRTDDGRPGRNLAIGGSAAAGIFAGVLGANAFDISTASAPWALFYRFVIAGWAIAVLLLALATYLGSGKPGDHQPLLAERGQHRLRVAILIYLVLLAVATVIALVSASRGSTRDTDKVRLRVSAAEFAALKKLCGVKLSADRIIGKIRVPSEKEQFVIFDLSNTLNCTHSIEIPAREILAMQEDPPQVGRR